ncbi:hypothetical protein D3C78_1060320 [compost metagenome]
MTDGAGAAPLTFPLPEETGPTRETTIQDHPIAAITIMLPLSCPIFGGHQMASVIVVIALKGGLRLPVDAIESLQLDGGEMSLLIDETQGQATIVFNPAGAAFGVRAHRQAIAIDIRDRRQPPFISLPAEMQEGRSRLGQDHLIGLIPQVGCRLRHPVGDHGHGGRRQRQLDG